LEHPPSNAGAGGRNRFLFLGLVFLGEVQPAAALAHLPEARMLAFAEAVEISLGGVASQTAIYAP